MEQPDSSEFIQRLHTMHLPPIFLFTCILPVFMTRTRLHTIKHVGNRHQLITVKLYNNTIILTSVELN